MTTETIREVDRKSVRDDAIVRVTEIRAQLEQCLRDLDDVGAAVEHANPGHVDTPGCPQPATPSAYLAYASTLYF